MKMFIPTIGTRLQLSKPWTFTVLPLSYNNSIINKLSIPIDIEKARFKEYYLRQGQITQEQYNSIISEIDITFEKGLILIVDKISVTKSSSKIDYIILKIEKVKTNTEHLRGIRFCVQLDDINNMEFDLLSK